MKKILLGTVLLGLAIVAPVPAMAGISVGIGISLPLPIVFRAPPDVIVMPDTNGVYVVPDIEADMYFWNGWWWRPWEGRWYRSHQYNRGWSYYDSTPSFYFDVNPAWRTSYRDRSWSGYRWDYERVANRQLQQNWKTWNTNRHWERQGTWGVQNYKPRSPQQVQELRHQRQEQYQGRPEVQRHQQQRQQQPVRLQSERPQQPVERQQQQPARQQSERKQQPQERSQPHAEHNQGEVQHEQPRGKQDGDNSEHRR